MGEQAAQPLAMKSVDEHPAASVTVSPTEPA
jgi:hypothetical protein